MLLIFNFQFSLLFFNISLDEHCACTSTAAYYWFYYAISDIGRCRKFGEVLFLYGTYISEKDFELILTVKMETRHPVERPCGSEFPVICNHCGVMTAWKSQDLEILLAIFAFFWKNDQSQTVTTVRIAPKICQGQPPH